MLEEATILARLDALEETLTAVVQKSAVTPPVLAVTTAEAARMVGRTRKTLNNWRYKGKGPRWTRTGDNSVVYKVSDIEEWLDGQAIEGAV